MSAIDLFMAGGGTVGSGPLSDAGILVHVAWPVLYAEHGPTWIEGEPGTGPRPEKGMAFAAVLFLPQGSEDNAGPRSRKFSRPTLLFEPPASVSADDELLVFAPELAAWFEQASGEPAGTGRWQVEGEPQPFGPPGEVIGVQATLKQVRA